MYLPFPLGSEWRCQFLTASPLTGHRPETPWRRPENAL
jgi:hypothetical protein